MTVAIVGLRNAHAALGQKVQQREGNAYVDAFRHVLNPRLRFHRFLPCQDDNPARAEFLDSFGNIAASELAPYTAHYQHVCAVLTERDATSVNYKTASRLALGLGDETVIEIGIRLHHTYGVPVIPGAAQKGLCTRYAAAVFQLSAEQRKAVFGGGGSTGQAGTVVFHDALWKPDGNPFLVDVVTSHHPRYYQGAAAPTEWDSPEPHPYLTAHGTFTFALEGEPRAVAFAVRVLAAALADWGIGARTAKGYGRFQTGAELQYRNTAPPPEHARPATPAGAFVLGVTALHEESQSDVTVKFDAGRGMFVMRLQVGEVDQGAQVKADVPGLFETEEIKTAAMAKAKKRKELVCRVRYRREGNLIVVTRLDPNLPGAGS
jgi:CRISPR/Cas system CMR subunit Cmr6 (Cas7 group RAMP superfamily)